MIVLYVDHLGIAYSSNRKDLDKLFQDLNDLGLEFTCEGTFTDFLGVKFIKDEVTNTVTLTQKGLIQKIIKATGLQDCNPNHTLLCKHTLGLILMEYPWMSSGTTALLLECSCTCEQTQGQMSHLQSVKLPASTILPRRAMPVQ